MTRNWRALWSFAIAAGFTIGASAQAVQPGSPSQAPAAVKGTGAIFGQVLDAGSGQPIAEAVVTLTDRSPVSGSAAPPAPVLTDAKGRFLFHGLGKGPFVLAATAPGFMNSAAPRPVTLDLGQRISDVKIRLAKSPVVSGTVFDEAGEPAVGVWVNVVRPGVVGWGGVSTDDRGTYRRVLQPGDWLLAVPQSRTTMPVALLDAMSQLQASAPSALPNRGIAGSPSGKETRIRVGDLVVSSSGSAPVMSPDGRLLAYQSVFYASAATQAQATVITLQSGEERTGIDFHLRLVPTSSVSGIVTGANGPLKNAGVELVTLASDVASVFGSNEAMTQTRDDGTFTFLAVPEGPYVVRVIRFPATPRPGSDSAELGQMLQSMMREDVDTKVLLFAEARVVVANTDVTGVKLALREGIKVTGRLEFDGAQPAPTGAQLRSFSVSLLPVGPTSLGGGPTATMIEEDGRFKTPGKVSGRHWLNVESFGGSRAARPWVVKSVIVAGRDIANDGVELKDADVNDALVILTDKTGTVTGAIRGPDGLPPTGVSVILIPGGYQGWIDNAEMTRRRLRRIPLSPSGTYSFDLLLAGDYWLAAIDDAEFRESAAFYRAIARVATAVRIGEDERKTQDLQVVKVVR